MGNPRTAANHSIPGKAEKAAKARERFAKRPYRVEGDLELERRQIMKRLLILMGSLLVG